MANVALAYAQEANETTSMTNLTQTEEEEEEHGAFTEGSSFSGRKKKNIMQQSPVRDSVTELLQDKVIPGGDFISPL